MRFASLGSGSEGNGLLVQAGTTRVLLDCGFGLRDSASRLARLGVTPEQLSGIVLTHEHQDHMGGVLKLANKYQLPVWLTHGTYRMMQRFMSKPRASLHIIDSDGAFSIGDLELLPFPVPHDAREPVQFVFSDGACRLGVLTDTGTSTPHIENMLSHCHALVLECNHDADMLLNGSYSRQLKQRVGSRLGHLDNQTAATLLSRLDTGKLQHIIAAHLSAKNNTPALAQAALSQALGCEADWIGIAAQDSGFDWREMSLT